MDLEGRAEGTEEININLGILADMPNLSDLDPVNSNLKGPLWILKQMNQFSPDFFPLLCARSF